MPKFDIFLKYLMYLFFALVFLSFIINDHLIVVYTTVFLVTFYSMGLIYASFRSWQLNIPGSEFFILAWSLSMVSSFLASIMVQGYVDYTHTYYYFYGMATIIDIVLLAFALAARFFAIQKDKELVQHSLIEKEKEISLMHINENKKLEDIVAQRTKELININKELKNLSITDKLTGLYNRSKLDESLEYEIKYSKRYHEKFGLIMLDIDYFKDVNDTYGHQVGDIVLIEFANILKLNIRETDVIGRWGGEEFIIICPKSDLNGIKILTENIRKNIESFEFSEVQHKTASFGITVFQNNDTFSDMLKRVDDALYEAKESGRNKVCIN